MNLIESADKITLQPPDTGVCKDFLSRKFPDGLRRVLLINPPEIDKNAFDIATAKVGRYSNYPPYGLGLLATHLRNSGLDVSICNLNHHVLEAARKCDNGETFDFDAVWQEVFTQVVEEFSPDLIGITCLFTVTHDNFYNVCTFAKAHADIPLAIGGVHITGYISSGRTEFDDVADFIFLREADVSIKRFVDVVAGQMALEELGQIIFNIDAVPHRFDAKVIPEPFEMDAVPAYDLMNIRESSKLGVVGNFVAFVPPGTRIASVLTNRGCRGRCEFCGVPQFNGPGVRQRSVSSVLDEMEILENEYGIKHITWLDDDLLKDGKRIVRLFEEKVKRGISMTWDATNGLIGAACSEEVMTAASASGCVAFNIGLESGSPHILKSMRKPASVQGYRKAAKIFRKHENIFINATVIIGYPHETFSMILDTLRLLIEMNLDWYRISVLQPVPNTAVFDQMVAEGLIEQTNDIKRFTLGPTGTQKEFEQGIRKAEPYRDPLETISMDAEPTPEEISDIWFFMNYYANFHKILIERRPKKIELLKTYMKDLCNVISYDNAFSLYYLAYLQDISGEGIDPEIAERLKRRLETSEYWSQRFEAFGLSYDHLETGQFPNADDTLPPILTRAD